MSWSNDEVLELLNRKYTGGQIKLAFAEMAKQGYKVNPDDKEFDDNVVGELEKILDAIATGIDEQKSLPQSSSSVEEITTSAIALAQSKLVHTNAKPELVGALIRSLFQKDIEVLSTIIEMRRRAINLSLGQGEASLLQDIFTSSSATADLVAKFASNPEAINKILAGYGINDVASQNAAFIKQSRDNAVVVKQKVAQFLAEAKQREQVLADQDIWDVLAEDMGQ